MRKHKLIIMILALIITGGMYSQKEFTVGSFDKIIISPHIEATLIQGDKGSVKIISSSVDEDKINVEINGNNLRVYLDDAKEIPKNEKVILNGHKTKKPLYNGTVLMVEITYTELHEVSFRGEEKLLIQSPLHQDEFELKIYGASEVIMNDVDLDEMDTVIYGEAYLLIRSGVIKEQKFIAHGESKIDVLGVENETTKLTAYGEAEFEINANKKIKITSYGEPRISYKGNAEISKGISIGNETIRKIDGQ